MDSIDEKILTVLRSDARTSLTDIAAQVGLSPAPVKRRIERLEQTGVIEGYTAIINYTRTGTQIEAFTEVRLPGSTDVNELWEELQRTPEVEQMFMVAGDSDALIRIRVGDVEHLQRVVNDLRRKGSVVGTKTLMVLTSWQRR